MFLGVVLFLMSDVPLYAYRLLRWRETVSMLEHMAESADSVQ